MSLRRKTLFGGLEILDSVLGFSIITDDSVQIGDNLTVSNNVTVGGDESITGSLTVNTTINTDDIDSLSATLNISATNQVLLTAGNIVTVDGPGLDVTGLAVIGTTLAVGTSITVDTGLTIALAGITTTAGLNITTGLTSDMVITTRDLTINADPTINGALTIEPQYADTTVFDATGVTFNDNTVFNNSMDINSSMDIDGTVDIEGDINITGNSTDLIGTAINSVSFEIYQEGTFSLTSASGLLWTGAEAEFQSTVNITGLLTTNEIEVVKSDSGSFTGASATLFTASQGRAWLVVVYEESISSGAQEYVSAIITSLNAVGAGTATIQTLASQDLSLSTTNQTPTSIDIQCTGSSTSNTKRVVNFKIILTFFLSYIFSSICQSPLFRGVFLFS